MNRDEKLDVALKRLASSSPAAVYIGDIGRKFDFNDKEVYELADALAAEGLAKSLDTKTRMLITDLGRQIDHDGGWLVQCERIQEERKQAKEIEILEHKKLKWDAKISEWQVRTRWWPLIISIASLALAIISLAIR